MNSEGKIQQQIVFFFRNTFCLKHHNPRYSIFSVPNETFNFLELKSKINIGLLSGVSDLIVVLPNKTIFVEVKDYKGKQSDKQKDFESTITNLNQNYYLVRTLEEFKNIKEIKDLLK